MTLVLEVASQLSSSQELLFVESIQNSYPVAPELESQLRETSRGRSVLLLAGLCLLKTPGSTPVRKRHQLPLSASVVPSLLFALACQ